MSSDCLFVLERVTTITDAVLIITLGGWVVFSTEPKIRAVFDKILTPLSVAAVILTLATMSTVL